MAEREAVELGFKVPRGRASTRTVDRTVKVGEPRVGAPSLLDDLLQASGIALSATSTHLKKKIAEDKARQTDRALLNEQPSDDATRAGYKAHALVNMQRAGIQHSIEMQKEAEKFRGTDEEWLEFSGGRRSQLQDEVYEKYPLLKDDADSAKMWANVFSEQAPKVTAARVAGKLNIEHQDRLETVRDIMYLSLDQWEDDDTTQEQINAEMFDMMESKRKAMKLTQADMETIFIDAAVQKAMEGDTRLIEFSKTYDPRAIGQAAAGGAIGVEGEGAFISGEATEDPDAPKPVVNLFERTPQLQKAEEAAKKYNASRDVEASIIVRDDYMKAILSGSIDREQASKLRIELNAKHGEGYITVPQVMGWLGQRAVAVGKQEALDFMVRQISDKTVVAGLQAFDPKDLKKGVDEYWVRKSAMIERAVAENPEYEDQIRQQGMADFADVMAQNGTVHQGWKDKVEGAARYDVRQLGEGEKLPNEVVEGLMFYSTIPASAQPNHAGAKEGAIAENWTSLRALGYSNEQALQMAQASVDNPQTLTPDVLEKIRSGARDLAEDAINTSFLSMIKWDSIEVDRFTTEVEDMMTLAMRAGHRTPESAKAFVEKGIAKSYSNINGKMVRGNRVNIANQLGVHPDDIDTAFEEYVEANSLAMEDAGLQGDYFIDLQPNGTVVFRDTETNVIVTDPIPLNQISGESIERRKLNKNQQNLPAVEAEEEGKEVVDLSYPPRTYTRKEASNATRERVKKASAGPRPGALPVRGNLAATPDGLRGPAPSKSSGEQATPRATTAFDVKTGETMFMSGLMQAENDKREGFNKAAGTWSPHESFEGGTPTIGYGYKLTQGEMKRGWIEYNGQRLRFKEGESQITEEVAKGLMDQEVQRRDLVLAQNIKGFDKLKPAYRQILQAIAYQDRNWTQIGKSKSPKGWPKLLAAMKAGNDGEVWNQMVTKTKKDGKWLPHNRRRAIIAEAAGLPFNA